MTVLAHHFADGGFWMYPILLCAITVLCAALGAWGRLWQRRPDAEALVAELERALAHGDVESAMATAAMTGGAAGRVALAGLRESLHHVSRIEAALASALLVELPRLRVGQGTLRATTQLAMLFGLLGTTLGVFAWTGCNTDAYSRACAFARNLSYALHCNAFGLATSTTSLLFAALIEARSEKLARELQLVARTTSNRLRTHRRELRWDGRRVLDERPTYRSAA